MGLMYDKIRMLPLFVGASEQHISNFLEKTCIEFSSFAPGAPVVEAGDPCPDLKCLISGSLRICREVSRGVSFEYILPEGSFLGVELLFGASHSFPYSAIAECDSVLMTFPKAAYLHLLSSDNIFIFNFANYLSVRARRADSLCPDSRCGSVAALLRRLIILYTDTRTTGIALRAGKAGLSRFCAMTEDRVEAEIDSLSALGAFCRDDDRIAVPDREAFLKFTV